MKSSKSKLFEPTLAPAAVSVLHPMHLAIHMQTKDNDHELTASIYTAVAMSSQSRLIQKQVRQAPVAPT